MPFFAELDGQRIDAIYHSSLDNVPEGVSLLLDEDFVLIQKSGGDFGLFDYVNGRVVSSDRARLKAASPAEDIEAIKEAIQELASSLPAQSPKLSAAVARLLPKKA